MSRLPATALSWDDCHFCGTVCEPGLSRFYDRCGGCDQIACHECIRNEVCCSKRHCETCKEVFEVAEMVPEPDTDRPIYWCPPCDRAAEVALRAMMERYEATGEVA